MWAIRKKKFSATISVLLNIFRRGSTGKIRYYLNDERIIYLNKELLLALNESMTIPPE